MGLVDRVGAFRTTLLLLVPSLYYTTSTTTIQLVGTCMTQHRRNKKREDLVLGDLSFFSQRSLNNMMWGGTHEAYVAWLHGYERLEKNK